PALLERSGIRVANPYAVSRIIMAALERPRDHREPPMSSTYTYPGVYIQELTSPVHPITGVATSVAAFVGYTATGIDNRAEMIFSLSDYERLFGGPASNSELSYAVQQFFNNGGAQAWVVRTPGSYNNPPASEPPYA